MASRNLIVVLALVFVVASVSATVLKPNKFDKPADKSWTVNGTPGFKYNCAGKADGNYPHPTKCTHYVACVAGTEAYEMPCAMGPEGKRLHYVSWSGPNPATSYCDYPEVAGCDGGCKLV